MVGSRPSRSNNLAIGMAVRHKGPQKNNLNCQGYFCAAPKLSLFAMACLAASCLMGQSAEETLRRVDRYRYPWSSFSVDVTLQDGKVQQQWRVLVREDGDARVEGLSEKERGRTVLLLKEQMWLLLPDAKRPVKVSPQQRLLGPAAGGDLARFRFSGDYALTSEREELVDGVSTRRLELQAGRRSLSYQKAVLWLNGDGQPLKSDFFYASGKLARTARFGAIVSEHGAQVLSSLDLEEPTGRKVRLGFSHWKPVQAEDRLFLLPD